MNPMRLFWGILLTGFGVLIIASQLGYVSSNFWVNLLYLWPVILIVIGLRFIVHDDTIFTVVMLAILAVSGVFAAKGSFPGLPEFSEQNTYSQNITEKADSSAKKASYKFDLGAVDVTLNGVDNLDSNMIDVSSHNMGKLSVSQTVNNGTSNVSVSEEVDHGNIFGPVNRKRELTANISNSLPTDVEVNTGASKFNFDFSKLKLENFTLSSGAVTGEVTFGKNVSLLSGKIETGASSITVRVPKGVGLKVNYKGALNNPNFASGLGLNKTGDDLYQTADYDSSANKIDLSIDAGVSSIKIIQY